MGAAISDDYIIALLNSTFISLYVDNFVNNTQTFQINDARQLPVIIPTKDEMEEAQQIVDKAIKLKILNSSEDDSLTSIQATTDDYVNRLYAI